MVRHGKHTSQRRRVHALKIAALPWICKTFLRQRGNFVLFIRVRSALKVPATALPRAGMIEAVGRVLAHLPRAGLSHAVPHGRDRAPGVPRKCGAAGPPTSGPWVPGENPLTPGKCVWLAGEPIENCGWWMVDGRGVGVRSQTVVLLEAKGLPHTSPGQGPISANLF